MGSHESEIGRYLRSAVQREDHVKREQLAKRRVLLPKVNVALIIDDLCMGGAERQVVELALALDKNRFQVLVITLFSGQPLEEELACQPGIELISLNRRGKFDFGILKKLAGILKSHEIHVLQAYLTPATFFALTASRLARTPVVIVTERSGLRAEPKLGEKIYRFSEDRMTHFADAAIANSRSGELFLQSRGIPRRLTSVIYNGTNQNRVSVTKAQVTNARHELGIGGDDLVVGVAASLTPAKDHANFLHAAALVATEVPTARFLIVGEGPLRPGLEEMAAELGISDRVVFAGQHAEIAPYIGCFDLAVLPSKDYEGCSNFLLEAMGLGKACIATNVGGNPELITDNENGLLVPPRDSAALAKAIIGLLSDPTRAMRLAETAQARFRTEFSLGRMVAEYTSVWESLLKRRGLELETQSSDNATLPGRRFQTRGSNERT
jgi:glycosyltransferase involved in cell wall biosynthesis